MRPNITARLTLNCLNIFRALSHTNNSQKLVQSRMTKYNCYGVNKHGRHCERIGRFLVQFPPGLGRV